jgi:hypothetical protein
MAKENAARRLMVELAMLDVYLVCGIDTALQRARVVFARVEFEAI